MLLHIVPRQRSHTMVIGRTRCGWGCWGGAISSGRDVMVMFTFISCNDSLHIRRSSLYMFTYRTIRSCTLIVAPNIHQNKRRCQQNKKTSYIMFHNRIISTDMYSISKTRYYLGWGFPLTTFCPYLRHL